MQTISANLKAALIDIDARVTPRVLVDLYELYASSYVPGVNGFDPASAIEKFASETITWNGLSYRREVISRGDINRSMGQQQNSVSLTFSNVSRYMATLAQAQVLEGLFLVIRCVVPTVTDDSLVLFTGRLQKPSNIDKGTFSVDAQQDIGAVNSDLPYSKFLADDPNGRLPSDPLFEGYRFTAHPGSFAVSQQVPSTSFFGRLFGRTKKVTSTQQYTSLDDTPYGQSVPEVFGSCQMPGIPIAFTDVGYWTWNIWVWCKGKISAISNFVVRDALPPGAGLFTQNDHLGDIGGTGTNAVESPQNPGGGLYSLTAYTGLTIHQPIDQKTGLSITGGITQAPTVTALIRGRLVDLPDSSGTYNQIDWTDNPVHIARYILTAARFMNINPAFMEDAVNYLTSLHCDEPLIDDTNGQKILIPSPDIPKAGASFFRYQSTGQINTRSLLKQLGDASVVPETVDGPYTSFNPLAVPNLFATAFLVRKRYTANVPITGDVRAIDFLYKTIFPAFKGFLRINKRGKTELRSERSSDSTRVRAVTAVGDTSIKVLDATPWKTGPDLLLGRLLIGNGLTTSEVRDISSAVFSSDGNAIPLVASATGGSTATASGANLTGGSSSVQASGTVAMGGAPAPGDVISVTIAGVLIQYTLQAAPAATGGDPRLKSGVTLAGQTVGPGEWKYYSVYVPAGATQLDVEAVGSGDGVLYVRLGQRPDTATYDSTSYQASPESCVIANPAAGTWWIGVYGRPTGASYSIQATVTGGGVVPDGSDSVNTAAGMMAALINANARLKNFIAATWDPASPTIVTIKAKYGLLNLSSALLKAHNIGVGDPAAAPTIAAAGGGSRSAGVYQVGYSDVTAAGTTALTPVATVTLAANQQIAVSALPAFPSGVISRNFYLSEEVGSTRVRFVVNRTDAANFNINALPLPNAALPPGSNTTAEELIRVAMSLATNSQDVLPAWSPGITVAVNDVYLPATINSHKYKCTAITTGITGSTEPAFPTGAGATVVDGGVTWTELGETVLGQAGLTRANVLKGSYNWPLGSAQSSINQIKISFRDRSNDFALTPYTVNDYPHQLQVGKPYPLDVDGSAIDSFHQMFRIANWQLAKYRDGDWFNTMGTGPQGMVLEEGDVICSSDDSGGLINVVTRIEDISITPEHEVIINQARRYSTSMFSDDARAQTIPVPSVLHFTGTSPSIAYFIDDFAISDSDALTPGFYVAVSRDLTVLGDWRGWVLYADYGDGYVEIARSDLAALIGVCSTTLGTIADPSIMDTTNTVRFVLKYGPPTGAPSPFVTVTADQLTANPRRNLFRIGNEYLQAMTITKNADQDYTLSNLLRARFGTAQRVSGHGAGEQAIYLDGSEQFVQIDPVRLKTAYNYKAQTINQDLSAAAATSFTWSGGTAKLPPVDQIKGTRNAAGDLTVDWLKRTRTGIGMAPWTDVQGDYDDIYEIDISSGGNVIKTYRLDANGSLPVQWDYYPGVLGGPAPAADGSLQQSALNVLDQAFSKLLIYGDFIFQMRVDHTNRSGTPQQEGGIVILSAVTNNAGLPVFPGWSPDSGGLGVNIELDASKDVQTQTDDLLAIELRGSTLRYYLNFNGRQSAPLFVTSVPQLVFPLRIKAQLDGSSFATGYTQIISKPTLLRFGTPEFFYSTIMQTSDFGSVQSSVTMTIYPVSRVIGRGEGVTVTI